MPAAARGAAADRRDALTQVEPCTPVPSQITNAAASDRSAGSGGRWKYSLDAHGVSRSALGRSRERRELVGPGRDGADRARARGRAGDRGHAPPLLAQRRGMPAHVMLVAPFAAARERRDEHLADVREVVTASDDFSSRSLVGAVRGRRLPCARAARPFTELAHGLRGRFSHWNSCLTDVQAAKTRQVTPAPPGQASARSFGS